MLRHLSNESFQTGWLFGFGFSFGFGLLYQSDLLYFFLLFCFLLTENFLLFFPLEVELHFRYFLFDVVEFIVESIVLGAGYLIFPLLLALFEVGFGVIGF